MEKLGSESHPVRVAVIGAGPAGFYAADQLLKQDDHVVAVDMYDRLPTPFGLVRAGVAPDHPKIKNVTRVFELTAGHPRFRFFGNVEIGRHLQVDDLRRHYHQLLFATGAQTDRELGIPGEDLARSHSATEFVAWYNGHPDYRHLEFDLTQERVAVVGVGNVAVDVARMLCRTPDELARTDIADYALEALQASRVREVVLLGRRGPAQAAFTTPEVKELGDLPAADVRVPPAEASLDPASRKHVEQEDDRQTRKKVEIVQSYAQQERGKRSKTLTIRFLVSPVEFVDDGQGGVGQVRLVRNELYETDDGRLRPRATDEFETLDASLVFRSIGYRGVPLPGLPFYEKWGVVPHDCGRVCDEHGGSCLPGLYVTGWIKRGATGVIGTNKPDAAETVACMMEDVQRGAVLEPTDASPQATEAVVRERQPHVFSYTDWRRLDDWETSQGEASGRPRVKLTRIEEMIDTLERMNQEHAVAE